MEIIFWFSSPTKSVEDESEASQRILELDPGNGIMRFI